MSKGEFDFIDRIRTAFATPLAEGFVGIGDDCAILPTEGDHDWLISTDMVIEGVHFLRHDAQPEDVGYKSAAVNISDIAAMGGEPVATFLSIALPKDAQGEWAERFMEGYRTISERYGVALLGGDTTSSVRDIAINVAIVGRCKRGTALLRSGARVGDTIYVTGPLGNSGAGLKAILKGVERTAEVERLIQSHYRPTPRIAEGQQLALSGRAHAMMDISDGIASDLGHICKASGVGAQIELDKLPISAELQALCAQQGWSATSLAASAGEDYELLVVGTPDLAQHVDCPLYPIGRITEGTTIEWLDNGQRVEFSQKGFTHF